MYLFNLILIKFPSEAWKTWKGKKVGGINSQRQIKLGLKTHIDTQLNKIHHIIEQAACYESSLLLNNVFQNAQKLQLFAKINKT